MHDGDKKPTRRTERMADLIREEIANYMIKGNKNGLIGFVTITRVEVTNDFKHAKVFYTAYGSDIEKKESAIGLEESAWTIRQHLMKVIRAKAVPNLEFVFDHGLENSFRVQELLNQVAHENDSDED
jgi:ribosome-binding factor A